MPHFPRTPAPAALLLWLAISAGYADAHEPGTVRMELFKAASTGTLSFLPDWKGKGDTKIQYLVRNNDPEVDVLLVFPACSVDGDGMDRMPAWQVADLDGVLDGSVAPPTGDGVRREPIWRLCQLSRATIPGVYLLRRGTVLKLQMGLDFRDPSGLLAPDETAPESFAIAVHSWFDMYAVDPSESDSLEKALVAGRKPKLGVLASYLKKVEAETFDARQRFSLFYRIDGNPANSSKGRFTRSSYEDLFLPAQLAEEPEKGSGPAMKPVPSGSSLLFALDDYRNPKKVIPAGGLDYDRQHYDLARIPVDSAGPAGDSVCLVPGRPDCLKFPQLCYGGDGDRGKVATNGKAAAATYTVTGRFSVKWTDHALHPGWGWRAVAWWNDGGSWTKLASEWVTWDGSYSLSINHSGYSGQHLRVQFRAYNRYFEPMDQDDNLYRWVNPDRYSIGTSHDEGHWYADADGGDANGIGEMYYGAYRLWSRLYWDGEINPLRPDPVQVYMPNTWDDCGDGSGVPASCASTSGSGTIWLTAANGIDDQAVQHEFAHNVNSEFHDNKLPAGAGGSHTLCGKFNEGLALREGYANFMPPWVQCDRGNGSCNTGFGNIESSVCSNTTDRDEREWYVAKTFWDLHDTNSDGNDILWYSHPGAVHKLYFENGPASDGDALGMTDFQTVYRNNCSAGHEGYIDDIFDQNVN